VQRYFAELTLSGANVLSKTEQWPLHCHPERSEGPVALCREMPRCPVRQSNDPSPVTLSEAKGLSHWAARCIAALSKTEQ